MTPCLPKPLNLLLGLTLVSSLSFSCSSSTFLASSLCWGWEHAISLAGAWRDNPPAKLTQWIWGAATPRGHSSVPSHCLSAAHCHGPGMLGHGAGKVGPPEGGLGSSLPPSPGWPRLTTSSCIFSNSRAAFLFREISLSLLLWASDPGEAFGDGRGGAGAWLSPGCRNIPSAFPLTHPKT